MKRNLVVGVVVWSAVVACLCWGLLAHGAPPGAKPMKATSGAVSILSTATAVWTASTGLSDRNAFSIFNNGTQIIYCGWVSNVTVLTGFPVGIGGVLSIDVTWTAGDKQLYCINASGSQSTPNDTRWIQVR